MKTTNESETLALLKEILRLKDEVVREKDCHLEQLRNHYSFLKVLLHRAGTDASNILSQLPPTSNN